MGGYFSRLIGALCLVVYLHGCGGGKQNDGIGTITKEASVLVSATRSSEDPTGDLAAIGPRKITAKAGVATDELTPSVFFDWAENSFPQIFPSHQPDKVAGPFVYRFYPEGNLYLAVEGATVLALGPITGNQVIVLGRLSDFTCAVFPEVCQPPVAVVGPDQSVKVGATVQLNGGQSFDPSGDALAFSWSLISKPVGSVSQLSSASAMSPTFTPDFPGVYVASLTVTDGALGSEPSTVAITVTLANAVPVANAGLNRTVTTGTAVLIDGTASSDADGDSLRFAWTLTQKPAGSNASLSAGNIAKPSFTPDVSGQYRFSLVVNDTKSDSAPAFLIITANAANAAPVAAPGGAQSVNTGSVVYLNGSGSSDPNGDAITYQWAVQSRPSGSSASLSLANTVAPNFTADFPGTYVLSLVVSDGGLSSAAATVTVTAVGAALPPPRTCCKVCTTGKACGNSCISFTYTCRVGPGCAC